MAKLVDDPTYGVSTGGGFINTSKGASPTKAVAATDEAPSLFSSILNESGNLVDQTAHTINTFLENRIENGTDGLKAIENRVNEDFGINAGIDTVGAGNNAPTDPGIENGLKELSRYKKAYAMGAVGETQYQAYVLAKTRALKQSFAGPLQQAYIDKRTEALFGVSQNALRRSMLHDALKSSETASAENKAWHAAWNQNSEYLSPQDAALARTDFPAFRNKYPNPIDLDRAGFTNRWADNQAKMASTQLALVKSKKDVSDIEKNSAFDAGMNAELTKFVTVTATSMPGGMAAIRKMAEENRLNPSPEKETALRNMMANYATQAKQQMVEYITTNGRELNMSSEEINKRVDQANNIIDRFMGPIANKDFGGLNALTAANETILQGGKLDLLQGNPMAAGQAAIVELHGQALANTSLANNEKNFTSILDYNNVVLGAANNAGPIKNLQDKMKNPTSAAVTGIVVQHQQAFKDLQDIPEAAKAMLEKMVGPDNMDYISRLSDPTARADAFHQYSNPEFVNLVKKDPKGWDQYRTFMNTEFTNSARKSFGELMTKKLANGQPMVQFNADTQRLEMNPSADPSLDRVRIKLAAPHIASINAGLSATNFGDIKDRGILMQALGSMFGELPIVSQKMKLGADGTPTPGDTEDVARLIGQPQIDAATGTMMERGELFNLLVNTSDPKLQAEIIEAIKALPSDSEISRTPGVTIPEDIRSPDRGNQPRVGPTSQGEITNRSDIAGKAADVTRAKLKEWGVPNDIADKLASIPETVFPVASFIDAISNGDKTGAVLAAASVIPFPGAKAAAKAGTAAVEGGAKVVSSTALEAARTVKGMDKLIETANREHALVNQKASSLIASIDQTGFSQLLDQATRLGKVGAAADIQGLNATVSRYAQALDAYNKMVAEYRKAGMPLTGEGLTLMRKHLEEYASAVEDTVSRINQYKKDFKPKG